MHNFPFRYFNTGSTEQIKIFFTLSRYITYFCLLQIWMVGVDLIVNQSEGSESPITKDLILKSNKKPNRWQSYPPRQDLSADDVAVVEPAVDERLEGAGHAQVLGDVLERRARVLPDELVRVGRPREQHLRLGSHVFQTDLELQGCPKHCKQADMTRLCQGYFASQQFN